jgi:periplasmic copper chaperone A
MLKKILITLSLITISSSVLAYEYKIGKLEIDHPYIRVTTGINVSAGFMTIENEGDQPDKLLSVTDVSFAKQVEIHETTMDNNVMKMRPLNQGLTIPAKSKVQLKPGSYHIMFISLTEPIVKNKKYKASLNFEQSGSITIEFNAEEAKGHYQEKHKD